MGEDKVLLNSYYVWNKPAEYGRFFCLLVTTYNYDGLQSLITYPVSSYVY